jgi:hypothetical protein
MSKKTILLLSLGIVGILTLALVLVGSAVSGAAFTTFNAHVDGAGKDVCKNTAINCNIYGAKEYVWLNGGPTASTSLPYWSPVVSQTPTTMVPRTCLTIVILAMTRGWPAQTRTITAPSL